MVYYADDTILFSRDTRGINELLKLTEKVSANYGLKLNRDKCVAIAMNGDGNIHFSDGTRLDKKYEATYLGHEVNKETNIMHEISNKIQEVRGTWMRLHAYWRATNANKKWQLIIFDAIVRSKLLYGLETLHLTQSMARKLDVFQLKGLRKILGMSTTFINRGNTNNKVYAEATRIAFNKEGDPRSIRRFSEFHNTRKASLLGHILRTDNEDPLRQVSFQPNTAYRVEYGKKRIGKPKQNWIHQAKKHVYTDMLHLFSYEETNAHDKQLLIHASAKAFF